MNIQQLTHCENVLLGMLPHCSSSERSDASHMCLPWGDVFREYVVLAREQGDVEALKRALFLIWYNVAEPEFVTGISRLDENGIQEVFRILNELAERGQLDRELTWMLPYYHSVADWYLSPKYDALKEASAKNKRLWMTGCLESSFSNRGQFGRYWQSIQDGLRKGVGPQ